MKEGYLDLNVGKLYYQVIGEGEPLVFIHGGPGLVHNYFIPYFLKLAHNGYQLIFFDQRGNGRSSSSYNDENITLETFTDDIERLRKELDLEKINILGHSMGGFFALDYAKKYSHHINKIILCNCVPFISEQLEEMNRTSNERISQYISELMNLQNSEGFKNYEPEALKKYLTLANSIGFYDKAQCFKLFTDSDLTKEFMENLNKINQKLLMEYPSIITDYKLETIESPTMLIHSDYDFIPLDSSKYICSKLKNCHMELIKDCGHYTFIEKTDELLSILIEFLKRSN